MFFGTLIIEKNAIFTKKTRKNAHLQFFAQKKNDKKRKIQKFRSKINFLAKNRQFCEKTIFFS